MKRIPFIVGGLLCVFAAPGVYAQEAAPEAAPPPAESAEIELIEASMSAEERLAEMGRVYEYQVGMLEAEAEGNFGAQEALLERSVQALAVLMDEPGIVGDARFRELYRTIVTEFELYYGVQADTLTLPVGTIFDVHEEMFAALDEGTIDAITLPELEPMETTIPMEVNRLVEQSVTYLLKNPEKTIDRWRERAQTYFPMIEQILREEGAPDELKYLAMVESGLVPTARSWARANGMWQFIAPTGRNYGLEVNHWVDERLDPEKATRAAARHLKDLYQLFDEDWHLAMAGYNCSPARVKRAIRRFERSHNRKATFWDIYRDLPRETRNYVPMFIAAALVISNEEAFKLSEIEEPGPRYEYEFVPVWGIIDLDTAAELAGTDASTLKVLNPELRTSMTPPVEGTYALRVPLGAGARFMEAYAELHQEDAPRDGVRYTVRSDDTIGKIARRYGVSVASLQRENGLSGNTIAQGQLLKIPVRPFRSKTAPDLPANAPTRVAYGTHRVYSVPIASLRGPQASSDGTVQSLAGLTTQKAAAARPRSSTTTRAAATSSSNANSNRIRYRVRRGDSLGKIARRHGVTVSQLRSWNNIRGSKILVGQRLTIYTKGGPAASSASSSSTTYRVRKGDSLFLIAKRHGVTITQLKRWNNLRSNVIRPGQRLKVSG